MSLESKTCWAVKCDGCNRYCKGIMSSDFDEVHFESDDHAHSAAADSEWMAEDEGKRHLCEDCIEKKFVGQDWDVVSEAVEDSWKWFYKPAAVGVSSESGDGA